MARDTNGHEQSAPASTTASTPVSATTPAGTKAGTVGPHPSFIQVARPFLFEQQIQECLAKLGTSTAKEEAARFQGVHWIDSVRRFLQLPLRTFDTAVLYYHKFRLVHADHDYLFMDAAAAALFTACKIEDTLKKSREILCAAYNLKASSADQLTPDDSVFEGSCKTILGLERLMLEASTFDFRTRHAQPLTLKFVKLTGVPVTTVGRLAFDVCNDLYRTFAVLKQTTATLALASLEFAARLSHHDTTAIIGEKGISLQQYSTTRLEIMETLLDLADLYTHNRTLTTVGPDFALEDFISVRLDLNKEVAAANMPRYTEWHDASDLRSQNSSTNDGHIKVTRGSALSARNIIGAMNPVDEKAADRGKDGTVRFMLDPERAVTEVTTVAGFFAEDEYEEYEEEIEVPI